MSFKLPETQEELEQMFQERVARAKKTVASEYEEKYKDYDEIKEKLSSYVDNEKTLKSQIDSLMTENSTLKTSNEELGSKMRNYETISVKRDIAHEMGLPYEMHTRLSGETEEEIRKDAEALKKIIGNQRVAPTYTGDNDKTSSKDEELKKLLHQIKGE